MHINQQNKTKVLPLRYK